MNKKQILSLLELARGIANFVLSIIFVLSTANGLFNYLLLCILGLILANVSLIRERLTIKNTIHRVT